jgi:UPF0176 protein
MFQIVNFYKFVRLTNLDTIREELRVLMTETGVRGTIILADEGFNAMLCGKDAEMTKFLLKAGEVLGTVFEPKVSYSDEAPLRKIDVKIKPEIVTLKQQVDISLGEGTHVGPKEWNELLLDPDTIVLDARNYYEIMNGSFRGALDPKTEKFSELPEFISKNLGDEKDTRIAMYCTGGIRCEKFAPYLRSKGFNNVFQLKGGILRYLETVKPSESLWEGECFVFDERRTLNERLEKGVQVDYSHPENRIKDGE